MVTTLTRLALALAFISAPVCAHAETMTLRGQIADDAAYSYKEAVKSCAGPTLAQCLQKEVRNATKSLAVTYKGVEQSLRASPKQTAGLHASQRAWSEFVKTNCEFLGSLTKDLTEYQACMLHYIETRSLELHTYIGWD